MKGVRRGRLLVVVLVSAAIVVASAVIRAPNPPVTGIRIAAAGDVACDPGSSSFKGGTGTDDDCRQVATSDLLVGEDYAAVLALGDLQYENGAQEAFLESYGPTWGRVKSVTAPVPGNHEYRTGRARGYFSYFGARAGDPDKGYYSFDLAGWHLVALNSNCSKIGGCGVGSPQERWLRRDLAASAARCTLAFWHHPRFSSGWHGDNDAYVAFWQALQDAGADVVLVGHDHDYERFAPQDAFGERDLARGVREFVVGTGGKKLRELPTLEPNSESHDDSTFGVLELTLGRSSYAWRFRPAVGSFADRGSSRCH